MNRIIDFKALKEMIYNYINAIANKLEHDDIQKNIVLICGIIRTLPQFSHSVVGENFYKVMVAVPRKSGVEDIIPVTISERTFDLSSLSVGKIVSLVGQFRSYKYITQEGRMQLKLTVLANEAEILNQDEYFRYENTILLDGYVCKKPVHRTTSLSGKEITDIMLAVNRRYYKTDYIPTVIWGRNAIYTADSSMGDRIVVTGRIESRQYEKPLESGEMLQRTVYEVAVSSVVVTGENNSKPEQQYCSDSVA